MTPPKPTVAVFGSNSPEPGELEAARQLGGLMNAGGARLLTGGDCSKPGTVKDAAICAAREEESADWIGVLNAKTSAPARRVGSAGLVLTPGFEHRRNFIEACICDAAIALGESDGTSSEALFALYLGRPLLLVNVERRSPSSAATLALKKRATARISVPVNPVAAIDQGIAAAYRWAEEPDRTPVYRSLPTDGPAATQMIRDVLQDAVARKVDMRALTDESAWNAFVTTTMRAAGRRP